MYGIGNEQFGQQDSAAGAAGAADEMVERIMGAEYNLAVQRGDAPHAAGVLASMFGQFLNRIFSR